MNKNFTEAFEKTKVAGTIAAGALVEVGKIVKPGISTDEIDRICYEYINDHKAYSAPLFYRGYARSLCTSLNHVICHGIPGDRILDEGDILNVDVTAIVDGYYGDTSRMYTVGKISVKAQNLIDTTYESLMKSIKILKPGIKLGDIGNDCLLYTSPSPRDDR